MRLIATSQLYKMVTAYDFQDDEQCNDLGDIGQRLSQTSKSKDSLIKLLKVNRCVSRHCFGKCCSLPLSHALSISQQAGEVLEKTSQTDAGAKSASKAVAKAVVHKSILDHKDKASHISCSTQQRAVLCVTHWNSCRT